MSDSLVGKINPNLQVPEIRRPRDWDRDKGSANFGEALQEAISAANALQKQSDSEIQKLMTGESQDLHTTLIAVQRADLSFQMMMQVRNKLVQAYQELMRTQV